MQQQSPPSSKSMSMYPASRPAGPAGLTRYGSAPGSVLTGIVDSLVGGGGGEYNVMGRYRSAGDSSPCLTSESSCKAAMPPDLDPTAAVAYRDKGGAGGLGIALERSYGLNEIAAADLAMGPSGAGGNLKVGPSLSSSPLIRHSSSPAGFFSHLMLDNGFSGGNYHPGGSDGPHHHHHPRHQAMANRRLKSQLSFSSSSRQDSHISHMSDISIPDTVDESSDEAPGCLVGHSYVSSSSSMPPAAGGSWDDTSSIAFSPSGKRVRDNNGVVIASFGSLESHQFGLTKASLDMDKLLQIHQDSIPCRIRAKRGCATHPRSIAERERRTRISEKLRKLQELVPNMDKQTNTADMLDMAVQHIKGLQSQVQKLNQERANCTCPGK